MKFNALKKLFFIGSVQIRPFSTRIIMGPRLENQPFWGFWSERSEIFAWAGAISKATITAFKFPAAPAAAVPLREPKTMMFHLAITLASRSTSPMMTMLASDSSTSPALKFPL